MIRLEPYAQELIAGVVEEPHDVRICDLAVKKRPLKAFKETLDEYKPDFIGFGGFSSQFCEKKVSKKRCQKRCQKKVTV